MKTITVITHDGVHHADEISAISLLNQFFATVVVRTYKPEPAEGEWVLDIGRIYDPAKLWFDHHHDASLPASNILVLNHLVEQGIIKPEIADYVRTRMFDFISDVDKGVIQQDGTPTINSIIRGFNGKIAGFERALKVMDDIVFNLLQDAEKYQVDKETWKKLNPVTSKARVSYDKEPLLAWREFAEVDGVDYLITPSSRGEGWNLISRDSVTNPIPVVEGQTFRHNSGFMAVWKTFNEVVDFLTK